MIIHDKMINTLFVASTAINKMLPEKSLGVGWDSLKFSFHSLLLPIVFPTRHLSWSYSESSRFSIVPSSFPIKFGGCQHCLHRLFSAFYVSEEYSITHYKLKDCLDLWQNEEATSDRHQYDHDFGFLWIAGSSILVLPQTQTRFTLEQISPDS